MKPAKYGYCAIAYGFTFCLAVAQSPAVLTPGTTTELVEAISTGTRTTFSLTGNTILNWKQLTLLEGSELVYHFQSGDKVLNLLSGSNRHRIEGTVTSNGIVGFFSPNANLNVTGTITANGVILSTLNVDPDEFFSEKGYTLHGGGNRLFVGGQITATDGDVILTAPRITFSEDAYVEASDSVLIGGGSEVSISETGRRRVSVSSEDGEIFHHGTSRASVIELVAGGSVVNEGKIHAGSGQVFIDVGAGMEITNESTGVIVADSVFSNAVIIGDGLIIPDEGDSALAVSDGILQLPELSSPDGRIVSRAMQISSNAPVSSSGDGGRDVRKTDGEGGKASAAAGRVSISKSKQVAKNRREARPLLRRSSFFGIRGGDEVVLRR